MPDALDDLPPSTVPTTTTITVKDFTDEAAAQQLGQAVGAIVKTVGSFIDLSRLDGVTVAIDYDAALAALNRGMEGLRPLSRSDTEEMQGVAMSPAVMRDGEVRTHIVLNAAMLVPLIADEADADGCEMALGIIAHECGHVQVTAEKERAVPDLRFGTRIEDYERAVMFQLAEIAWDEYAVCRLSAPFAKTQNASHALTVAASAAVAREQSNAAIRAYRTHADLNRLVGEAGAALAAPLKAAAYLLGGMDAEEQGWDDYPDARAAIEEADYAELVDRMHDELRSLWDSRGSWEPSLDTFQGIEDVARDLFRSGGIFFQHGGANGWRIDVPFTPETMPL